VQLSGEQKRAVLRVVLSTFNPRSIANARRIRIRCAKHDATLGIGSLFIVILIGFRFVSRCTDLFAGQR
jgi:hypothetical protein